MMDSIGYQFDPAQQKSIADSANAQMSQFGPNAQRALQVLAMRIPSLSGGQPAADGAPMEPPPMPMGMPGMPQQNGGMSGLVGGALNPAAPGAAPSPAPAPASPQQGGGGHSFTFNIPGMATTAPPDAQAGPGATQGGQMNGSPAPLPRRF
jgi:hypothetical protein